jgi:hypothetical protein
LKKPCRGTHDAALGARADRHFVTDVVLRATDANALEKRAPQRRFVVLRTLLKLVHIKTLFVVLVVGLEQPRLKPLLQPPVLFG